MKIVGTGQGGLRGDDLAVFIGSNELVSIIALLRRARDTVRHTENWEFSADLQRSDRVKLDLIADALEEVTYARVPAEELNV